MTKKKTIGIATALVILIAAMLLALNSCSNSLPKEPEARDINAIYGCPDFYDLKWGMTTEEADKVIKTAHDTILPENGDSGFIYTTKKVKLYGYSCSKVYVNFSQDALTSVMLMFPKGENSEVSMNNIVPIFTTIYGPADEENVWYGKDVTMDIFDMQMDDQAEKYIVVRYSRPVNSQFENIFTTGSGTTLDPFGLTGANNAFGENAAMLVDGMMEGADYTFHKVDGSYIQYILYPSYSYMGVPAGDAAVELYSRDNGKGINKVGYLFVMDSDETEYRQATLKNIYNEIGRQYKTTPSSITFTKYTLPDQPPIDQKLTEGEFFSLFEADEQGMYNVVWPIAENMNAVLFFSVNHYEANTAASVSFVRTDK